MPVYGRGRTQRKGFNEKLRDKTVIERVNGKRAFTRQINYDRTSTPIREIEKRIGFPIRATIKRMWQRKKRPIVVLDWGCGKGTAATEIARQFGKKVKMFGYSHVAYKEWKNNRNVTFIHAAKEDLARYAKGQVDFVFSHEGTVHLYPMHQLFEELSKFVAPGGKIVLSPHGIGPFLRLDGEPTAIGKAVFSAKITHGGTLTTLVITRIK